MFRRRVITTYVFSGSATLPISLPDHLINFSAKELPVTPSVEPSSWVALISPSFLLTRASRISDRASLDAWS